MSLRGRVVALVTGLTAGVVLMLLIALRLTSGQEATNLMRADVRAARALLDQQVRANGQSLAFACNLIARQPGLRNYLLGTATDWATVSDFARHEVLQRTDSHLVVITDSSGRTLGAAATGVAMDVTLPTAGTSLTSDALVAEVLAHPDQEKAPPARMALLRNTPLLEVVMPIREPVTGELQGLLIAYRLLDIPSLARALQAEMALVHEGQLIAASSIVSGSPLQLPEAEKTLKLVTLHNQPYMSFSVPIPELKGVQFVVFRRAEAMSAAARREAQFDTIALILLALSLLAGIFLAQSIAQPIKVLVEAARLLQEGQIPSLPPTHRRDELGVLQSTFREMATAIQSSQEQLRQEHLSTIQVLAAAVDAKDRYTQGHSQRVAHYAVELAQCLGYTEAKLERLFITGTLHDIGKIGVPDSVLHKPGPLTPEERSQMEQHPVLGELILKEVPQLADTLPGVRHHHERWDGKGYPDGLAGEAIPFEARILALADTFDAMTSDRPYRRGMSYERALEEIERCAGTQFDPELAPIFVVMMRSNTLRAEPRLAA